MFKKKKTHFSCGKTPVITFCATPPFSSFKIQKKKLNEKKVRFLSLNLQQNCNKNAMEIK